MVIKLTVFLIKICAQIPKTDVKFLARVPEGEEEDRDDSGQSIRGVFTISQRGAVLLRGGQALITFEEEKGKHDLITFFLINVVSYEI